jgi:hypothetical protein
MTWIITHKEFYWTGYEWSYLSSQAKEYNNESWAKTVAALVGGTVELAEHYKI